MKLIRVLLLTAGLVLACAAPAVAEEAQPDNEVQAETCYDANGFSYQQSPGYAPCNTVAPTASPTTVVCFNVIDGVVYPVETGKAEAESSGCDTEPPVTTPDVPGAFALASYQGEGHTPVTVCHNPGTPAQHELTFDDDGYEAHLAHGDTEGTCPAIEVVDVPDPADECGAPPDWSDETREAFRQAILEAAQGGYDFGPPPCGVIEECSVGIDPPITDIVVTLYVDGVLIGTASYDGNSPSHLAEFDLTGKVFGTQEITAEATWNIGTGTLVLEGEVTCPEAPPEPPTTTTPPTTAAPVLPTPGPSQPATPAAATSTPAGSLPHTGTDTGPLALGAVVALLTGLGAAWRYRSRTRLG
jgi:hypothetical protein